ncbi:MAG: hypothetical protein AAF299_17075 [Pseudomonadota bacterium]
MIKLIGLLILIIGSMKLLLGSNDAGMWPWVLPAGIGLLLFIVAGVGLMALLIGVADTPA